ncbi:MAG: TIGR04255 family protein [Syntrophobacteraceae bacterium]
MADPNMETPLPDFENPPVIEVICGIQFKPLAKFLTPHIGLLWGKYRAEYPETREVAPLDPTLGRYDDRSQISIEISDAPPLPRVWFLQKKGNCIIQVQRDRFLHNWRKVDNQEQYPRYDKVKQSFFDGLRHFESFMAENSLGTIDPVQYEMTYLNHVEQGEGWSDLGEIGNIFPDFSFRKTDDRFLPAPNGLNWHTSFLLPQTTSRLHVRIRYAKLRDTGKPLLILELTVRGIGEDRSPEAMDSWFDVAREWIVRGFADLTGNEVQKEIWKRRL